MTDSEREGVWFILNAISTFVARINNRMEYVVFSKRTTKDAGCNTESTWKHGFLWNKRGKRRWLKLKVS